MFKYLTGTALLWSLASTALAQTAPAPAPAPTVATVDADPALWVVRDDDTTLYLFGTVHVLKPGLSWFDEAVKKAFDESGQVVLELVMPDAAAVQASVAKYAINPTGPTLTERLPADRRAAYGAAMTGLGVPTNAFDRFDPWFAATNLSLITIMKAGYDPSSGAEQTLTAAAKAAGKPVIGLETMDQQLGFFDGLSERTQIAFLTATVDDLPKATTMIERMVSEWGAGTPDKLAATINEGMAATPELGKVLLADRNARWADWIVTRMKTPGTVFVAVGAGHLAGSESVQAMLKRKNVTVTRVAY